MRETADLHSTGKPRFSQVFYGGDEMDLQGVVWGTEWTEETEQQK